MNHRKTHNRLTKMFMGNSVDWHTIDKINKRIDNPTFQDVILSKFMNQYIGTFQIPYLQQVGHRKVNHNTFSAFNIGLQKGGTKGVQVAMWHYIEDIVSNMLRDNYGTDVRDLIEANLNYSFSRHRRHTAPRRFY